MTDHEKVREILKLKDNAPLELRPDRTALLIVDAQRYFARREYPFAVTFERLVPGSTDYHLVSVDSVVISNIQQLLKLF